MRVLVELAVEPAERPLSTPEMGGVSGLRRLRLKPVNARDMLLVVGLIRITRPPGGEHGKGQEPWSLTPWR